MLIQLSRVFKWVFLLTLAGISILCTPSTAWQPRLFAGAACSRSKGEFPMTRKARQNLCCSTGTVDVYGRPDPTEKPVAGKLIGRTWLEPGGGAINIAEAILAAGGSQPVVAPVTGADVAGNVLMALLQQQFTQVRRVAAATETRISLALPDMALTSRPTLDEASILGHVRPWLQSDCRLVLSSFRAEDARLVKELITSNPGPTVLLPTASQCTDQSTTIDLMALADLSWLNADELQVLTGDRDAAGINFLRSHGVKDVVVTDGPRGVTAYLDGFWFQRAFQADREITKLKLGDTACGMFLEGIDRAVPIDVALRMAMAAAAMRLSGVPRTGWSSIEAFAVCTPELPFVAPLPVTTALPQERHDKLDKLFTRTAALAIPATISFVVLLALTIVAGQS